MPIVTDNYMLSLTQDNRILRVRCSQNDTSRQVKFTIYNNGTLFTIPSGLSVSVHGIKQNGNIFTKSCLYSGSVVTLVLGTQITDIAGISVAELVFTDSSGGKIGTSNFIFQVESDPLLRGAISITEETPTEYISDLISMVEALSARVNNIIAPSGEASLSEVVDARLSGYSGTTYQNLKARIDADFAAIGNTKADKSNTYTKEEVDTAIDNVTITTDETLSVPGAAADSKKVGDKISEIKADLDDISNLYSTIIPNWTWELGTYTRGGALTLNDKRVRSGKHMLSTPLTLYVDDGYRYYVHYYASESATAHDATRQDGGVSEWITTSYTIDVNVWFAITIAKTAESGDYTASTDWGNYVYSIIENVLVNTVLSSKALAESNELRLDEVESALANDDLPEYWITYLDGKKDSIVNALADIGNHGDVFSYFTDYHAPLNAGHTAEILKYINNSVDMRKNIFGGDILTNHTKSQALTILNAFASDFKGLNLLSTNGNHEYNRYSGDTADRLTDAEWYAFLLGDNELDRRISFMSPNGYYYVDNTVQKIRYLFLNTNYNFTQFSADTAQIRWIISTLNSVEGGWGVVIFTHWYYGTVNADYTLTRDGIGDAIKEICDGFASKSTGTVTGVKTQFDVAYDFTNAKGEMICVICGHTHNDYAEQSESGYWVIATMCDAYHGSHQNPAITRTLGTVSEQAIDLYFIDRSERKISTIRIGAGSDRDFSY